MNRVIKFGVYFLIGIALISIFTAVLNGGWNAGEPESGSNPSTTPTANPTTTPERGDEYYTQEIADSLSKSNISVLSVRVENNVTTIRYVPKRPNESAVVEEIGTISTRYSTLVRDGWNVSKLEAKVIPPDKQTTGNSSNSTNTSSPPGSSSTNNSTNKSREAVATWHVKTKWVNSMDGDNASKKLLKKILDSIKLEGSGSISRVGRRGGGQDSSAPSVNRRGRVPDYPESENESAAQCTSAGDRNSQCENDSKSTTVVFGNGS